MEEIEDRMHDFNRNLLTVAMDAEDARAIMQATEGEEAYRGIRDMSPSQRTLNEIMERLQSTGEGEALERSLAAINLSMGTDMFDTVDMMLGAVLTTKEGEALYRAALPICREMAMEVCAESDIPIVISAYQMAIEQDCNAVQQAYEGISEQARERIFESGALLDIARLQNFQTRNADDILTCRRKMMEMLADSAVCGRNLDKCLDPHGRYVDPSTGDPILTANLYQLGNLIKRPGAGQTWAAGNSDFVTFLGSKRQFIEPATQQCEMIADHAWAAFIEDALSQIRIRQGRKLEEMRQQCTGIVVQCMGDGIQQFSDFDARAVSVFGIHSDKAVNAICAEVQEACNALMIKTPDGADAGGDWAQGMESIATQITFEQIMRTCTQVGQNCIVQNCTNLAGKFGLCGFDVSDPFRNRMRLNIIRREVCWNEVAECVRDADPATLQRIITDGLLDGSGNPADIILEEIWGSCEKPDDETPSKLVPAPDGHLQGIQGIILTGVPTIAAQTGGHQSLLAWFAQNTNPLQGGNSCFGGKCYNDVWHVRFNPNSGKAECINTDAGGDGMAHDGRICEPITSPQNTPTRRFRVTPGENGWTNCCSANAFDAFGNCCNDALMGTNVNTVHNAQVNLTGPPVGALGLGTNHQPHLSPRQVTAGGTSHAPTSICLPNNNAQLVARYQRPADCTGNNCQNISLFCVNGSMVGANNGNIAATTGGGAAVGQPANAHNFAHGTARCTGHFMEVNATTGMYSPPVYFNTSTTPPTPANPQPTGVQIASYYRSGTHVCAIDFFNGAWRRTPTHEHDSCAISTPPLINATVPLPPNRTNRFFMSIGPVPPFR